LGLYRIIKFKYLTDLIQVFHQAEQHGYSDRLTLSFYILKGVIGLNCQKIIEFLLSEPIYIETFGILECIFLFKILY